MKIERIDDKTVKCFLSNEELEEYNIDYKDFLLRSEKAKEVVQEIIEQAEEEVGYKPPKFAFDLQIMMMPEEGLVLTFSEREPGDFKDGEQILECLKDMKQLLQRTREKLGSVENSAQTESSEKSNQGKEQKNAVSAGVKPEKAVFAFHNLGTIMEYASVMPANLRVHSTLLHMGELYFLYLQRGSASYERYSRTCIQAMEFGSLYTADADRIQFLCEHGDCLIAEQALKKLRVNKAGKGAKRNEEAQNEEVQNKV